MLSKLLKYEIPAVARKLLPLYAAWMVISIMLGISIRGDGSFAPESLSVLTGILYVAITTAVIVMNFIILVQRYDKDLLGDGGYFSLILPVKMRTHILNKTISAGIWVIIGLLLTVVSGLLIASAGGDFSLLELFKIKISFSGAMQILVIVLNGLLFLFVCGCKFALQVYAAITLGRQLPKHNSLGAIGAYIVTLIFEYLIARIGIGFRILESLAKYMDSFAGCNLMIICCTLLVAVLGAIYFVVCNYLMNNRLNLG